MDAVELLLTRASQGKLREPAPDEATLRIAFEAALRAPDHGFSRPWRFLLVRDEARVRLGEVMCESLRRRNPAATEAELEREAKKPLRAPLIVVVVAQVRPHPKAKPIEQVLTAGAAAQNILLALHARGFAGMWRTGEPAYDAYVKHALGLGDDDAIVGFLYTGTPSLVAPPLPRPAVEDHVVEWRGPAQRS
jgi:nitroreductase